MILVTLLSLAFGFITFPILFYFQKLLKLPVPDLKKTDFHIHHSCYGLVLVAIGIIIAFLARTEGIYIATYGLGFIIHHEISEPGLKGLGKFIYLRKKSNNN